MVIYYRRNLIALLIMEILQVIYVVTLEGEVISTNKKLCALSYAYLMAAEKPY